MPVRPARALAAAALLAAGCAPVPPEPIALAEGSRWRVTAIEGQPLEAIPTLAVGAGEITGQTGCNLYAAPFRATGEGLAIGPPRVTEMACPPPAMAVEAAFLAAITRVDGLARRAAGGFVLTEAGRPRLDLAPAR